MEHINFLSGQFDDSDSVGVPLNAFGNAFETVSDRHSNGV